MDLAQVDTEVQTPFSDIVNRTLAVVRLWRGQFKRRLMMGYVYENPETPALTHFPLQSAYLCVQCDNVTNSAIRCSGCAGTSLISIAPILDRVEKRKKLRY